MKFFRPLMLAGVAMLLSRPVLAEWQAAEKVEPYSISGKTGPELYASIGEKGPKASTGTRVIAHTDFKLTWTRKYEPQPDGSCVLVTAKPKLIVTYRLPKPAGKLPAATQKNWDVFAAGVHKHELVHGDHIKEMVKAIEQMSIGFSAPADPGCKTIRTELTKRLAELSLTQRQRSRDFDRVEMSDGGNVHQLILNLVNE
ncbi:DUF922 domain-containing Zn-dependent protease [Aminobacter sp. HY435]|uniref:DUF922 domain-containing Zn-dependent protease n=1 Tax=Aminobacter sp. HY435 TaxID=2970917 RepID=UPI0022B9B85F|nr:DUF922 domain-containing protein [Aminobacter sp. HY435]